MRVRALILIPLLPLAITYHLLDKHFTGSSQPFTNIIYEALLDHKEAWKVLLFNIEPKDYSKKVAEHKLKVVIKKSKIDIDIAHKAIEVFSRWSISFQKNSMFANREMFNFKIKQLSDDRFTLYVYFDSWRLDDRANIDSKRIFTKEEILICLDEIKKRK